MRDATRPIQADNIDFEDQLVCLTQALIERGGKPCAFYAGCLVRIAAWHNMMATALHKTVLVLYTLPHPAITAQYEEVKGRRGQELSETDD